MEANSKHSMNKTFEMTKSPDYIRYQEEISINDKKGGTAVKRPFVINFFI